jgi:hypothetical protein
MAAGAAYQGRVPSAYQNRALFVEVEVPKDSSSETHKAPTAIVRPYPLRYEMTGHDRWTLDTSVFPRSHPTYLESLTIGLNKRI